VEEGVGTDSSTSHRYSALGDQTPLVYVLFLTPNFGSCVIYMGVSGGAHCLLN
jgi:hypothetical protein